MSTLLSGIRVLDFGRFIAGPYAAMLLADFGADVIRIERRDGGEDRPLGPVTESGDGGLFLNLNRNKRGLTLDLGHPRAGEIVERLVRTADIVVANLPLNVLQKLKLDYESLRAVKEDIILVMPSAFGPDGPYRDRIGFDGVAQAMSGAMSLTGFPEAPVRAAVSWVDYGTALHAAFGAMAALVHRQQTGQGQYVDVSLLATSVTFMTPFLMERALTDVVRGRQGNAGYYSAPSDSYRVRDGWIMVPTIGPAMFRRWVKLVGREDLLDDPRCRDDTTRGNHYPMINEVMAGWCADAHARRSPGRTRTSPHPVRPGVRTGRSARRSAGTSPGAAARDALRRQQCAPSPWRPRPCGSAVRRAKSAALPRRSASTPTKCCAKPALATRKLQSCVTRTRCNFRVTPPRAETARRSNSTMASGCWPTSSCVRR